MVDWRVASAFSGSEGESVWRGVGITLFYFGALAGYVGVIYLRRT
jgi:hypothetical protein